MCGQAPIFYLGFFLQFRVAECRVQIPPLAASQILPTHVREGIQVVFESGHLMALLLQMCLWPCRHTIKRGMCGDLGTESL